MRAVDTGDVEITADGATVRFAPVFGVLRARQDPNLEMRWGQFPEQEMKLSDTGSIYNVLTWGAKSGAAVRTTHSRAVAVAGAEAPPQASSSASSAFTSLRYLHGCDTPERGRAGAGAGRLLP